MINREILYKKMEFLVDDLLKENPPFDKASQNPALWNNIYRNYINYYSQLTENQRKNIIKEQKCSAKWHIHSFLFGFKRDQPYPYPELSKVSNDFIYWVQTKERILPGSATTTEKFDALNILKEKMAKHFPQSSISKTLKIPWFYVFSFNVFKDTDLIIAFDRTKSRGVLDTYIGLNAPEILFNISDFYGSGCCGFFYNTKKEFLRGLDLVFEFLDFFYPKFHKAIKEAYEESQINSDPK